MKKEFDFKKGDVISFCDELYYVVENNGSHGVVNPFGETYYVRNFYWSFDGVHAIFIRKASFRECQKLGFETKRIKAIERLRSNLKNGKIRFEWRKMDKSIRKDNIKEKFYKQDTDFD